MSRQGMTLRRHLLELQHKHPHIRRFIDYLTAHDRATHRPYSLRYTGAVVADVHRSLLEGGLYFYPPDDEHQAGKLRLLYECAPLALVIEQADGRASTGTQCILDIQIFISVYGAEVGNLTLKVLAPSGVYPAGASPRASSTSCSLEPLSWHFEAREDCRRCSRTSQSMSSSAPRWVCWVRLQ